MTEITMCTNETCWLRAGCYRNPASGTTPGERRQSWSEFKPIVANVGHQTLRFCEYFSPTTIVAAEAVWVAPGGKWCSDMSKAPHNERVLIKSDPRGEVYAAHWVKNVETDDEA